MEHTSRVKILLAAGVFYPDVGGPAIHVEKIAERLSKEDYRVQVLAYGDDENQKNFPFEVSRVSRSYPKLLQWIVYLSKVLFHSFSSDLIYAFDPTAAGVPARLGSIIFRKPFMIRVGGDPIWERQVEKGKRFMPITEYYEKGLYIEDKPTLYKIIKWLLSRAERVIVYNKFFKDFYTTYYSVPEDKFRIIKNPAFKRENYGDQFPDEPTILFAGRFVSYKNLHKVIEAFGRMNKGKLKLIGSGPEKENLEALVDNLGLRDRVVFIDKLPQEKLFDEIKNSSLCIAPALSEFNPNFILEALSFGKPVIISRGHGLSVDLPPEFHFDPMKLEDIEQCMKNILEPENYAKAVKTIGSLSLDQSWESVTDSHVEYIDELLRI